VQYEVGQWAYPAKGTKLFCFRDWESAYRFGEEERALNFLVWEAEVQNPVEEYKLYLSPIYAQDWALELEQRIKAVQTVHTLFIDRTWPKNTVFCDAVKLVKVAMASSDFVLEEE